ncbi:MAG TPA: M48 family metallopeptidase [Anaerolineales bacterium]|nr:M48 family metallopeptidase [Anaerolineales bacterium]
MARRFDTTSYRYANEHLILGVTLLLVFGVIALTAGATVCLSAVFVVAGVVMGYFSSRAHHQQLLQTARRAEEAAPELRPVLQEAAERLQVEPVDVFIVPSRVVNAYTFGITSPKAIVLHSALFQLMDRDELQFIIGHEMGHVRLGHTWLNTLVGGMAGIPSSTGALLLMEVAFRWWNRACEYSADRAGMLACANPRKAISALIKIEAGPAAIHSQAALENALARIESEDDSLSGNLGELLATHPMIIKRINHIRQYANSEQYRRLQAGMNQNLM